MHWPYRRGQVHGVAWLYDNSLLKELHETNINHFLKWYPYALITLH
jgi:hypothetical protein